MTTPVSKRPTLYQQLQHHIVPRLLVSLFIVGTLLCATIFYFAQIQITSEQQKFTEYLKADLQYSLENTQQLMQGIASNDLLINSFIDIEQRENYLPVFFQSLKFTRTEQFSLGLFQFDGSPIISRNWEGVVPAAFSDAWQYTTLQRSEPYRQVNEEGVLISVPVIISSQAEGALVLFLPFMQAFINARGNDAYQFILSDKNTILYTSHPARFPPGSLYARNEFMGWIAEEQSWLGLSFISQAPVFNAFSNVLWLVPAILMTLGSAILVSIYTSNQAARLSATTLQSLHDSIRQSARKKTAISSQAPDNEPQELFAIRGAFDGLIQNLMSMSLSNQQFSNVIDSLEEVLVVVDDDNNKLLINRTFTEYAKEFEITDSELLAIKRKLESGIDHLERHYLAAPIAIPVTIRWTMLPLTDDTRKQLGTILVGNDTTHKKSLENRINVISHAMKSATVALLIADAQAEGFPAIYVNPHFSTVTGYAEDQVLGQPTLFLNGMKAPQKKLIEVNAALHSGSSFNDTLLCYRQNDVPFYNQLILTPVYTDEVLTHFVVFFQDVTEQEQTQQFLEDAKQRAEESARLKSGFLASMSHEVRTPLHGVSGALQLVNKTNMTKEQLRYISLAKDSLRNLQHIVDDILDFSKIEAGQLGMEAIQYDLPLLLHTIYEQNSIACQNKGLTLLLETNLQPHTRVIGDPVRLRQILSNLLSNAVKFTEQGTITIKIDMQRSRNGAWLLKGVIEDTGIGIATNNLDSIFEVFRQEDISTTRRFGGTGLGLSISRQLCRLLGGDLFATSKKGQGSQFIFTLALGYVDATSRTDPSIEDTSPALGPHGKAKVLIVEDNEINQLIAREHLSQHKTMTTRHGKEALEALNRMKLTFDMILMDCHMPEMDGFETTKRIRNGEAGEKYKNVPIIALTANAMKGDKEQCYSAGMDDYISKPFTAQDLQDVVAKYMA